MVGPETKTDRLQNLVYVRHWKPSLYSLGPHIELATFPNPTRASLRLQVPDLSQSPSNRLHVSKLAELSGILYDHIEVAAAWGGYPDSISLFEIQGVRVTSIVEHGVHFNLQLEWSKDEPAHQTFLDGSCYYFRDATEAVKELSIQEKAILAKVCSE